MKLVSLLLSALVVATTLGSCKKTYICTCQSAWTQQWYDEPIKATSHRKANQECMDKVAPEVDGPLQCHLRP